MGEYIHNGNIVIYFEHFCFWVIYKRKGRKVFSAPYLEFYFDNKALLTPCNYFRGTLKNNASCYTFLF